jgi:hypothetical protein
MIHVLESSIMNELCHVVPMSSDTSTLIEKLTPFFRLTYCEILPLVHHRIIRDTERGAAHASHSIWSLARDVKIPAVVVLYKPPFNGALIIMTSY